jgi:hypothetical protein
VGAGDHGDVVKELPMRFKYLVLNSVLHYVDGPSRGGAGVLMVDGQYLSATHGY